MEIVPCKSSLNLGTHIASISNTQKSFKPWIQHIVLISRKKYLIALIICFSFNWQWLTSTPQQYLEYLWRLPFSIIYYHKTVPRICSDTNLAKSFIIVEYFLRTLQHIEKKFRSFSHISTPCNVWPSYFKKLSTAQKKEMINNSAKHIHCRFLISGKNLANSWEIILVVFQSIR